MSSLRLLALLSAFVVASTLADGFWPRGDYGHYGYGHGYGSEHGH
uniref:Neuropeptide-like protein 31 n=1 Tax=Steinernema glaseri TaxID=37863 RepID=A0A1I8AS90_9BILA